jgi:drug/metabolite transporter (DMT)-like permease
MSLLRLIILTVLTLVAFAANSVLCRLALGQTDIDAATFTTVRLVCGALALGLIARQVPGRGRVAGNWTSALTLFAYAAAFSFAYITLTVGTGSLLLFGAVQLTMILAGLRGGERLKLVQWAGLLLAAGGLFFLVSPGLTAPPIVGAALMIAAGVAWGVYSLRGRGSTNPLGETAGHFLRAAPLGLALSLAMLPWAQVDRMGLLYAALSGALTSGVGYAVWYSVLPGLRAITAATVQLSVPVIAALGGVLLLGESVTARLVLSSAAILGGIALVILTARRRKAPAAVKE